MSELVIEALTAEDNKFRCFLLGKKWLIMRGPHRIARVDRSALAYAILRAHLAYGKAVRR
ncbi:hypothetical protein [Glutamicibacter soli]